MLSGIQRHIGDIELNIIRGREDPRRSFVDFMESVNEQSSHVVESALPLARLYASTSIIIAALGSPLLICYLRVTPTQADTTLLWI